LFGDILNFVAKETRSIGNFIGHHPWVAGNVTNRSYGPGSISSEGRTNRSPKRNSYSTTPEPCGPGVLLF
jgi:hypothetical protein